MADVVLVEVADRVATVTLNRPEARNALNRDLLAALPEALLRLDGDDEGMPWSSPAPTPPFAPGST